MGIYKRKSEGLSTDIVCLFSKKNLIKLTNSRLHYKHASLTSSLSDDQSTTDSTGVTGYYLLSSLAELTPSEITDFTSSCLDCNWFAVKSLGSEETLDELKEVRIQAARLVRSDQTLALLCLDPALKAGEYSGLSSHGWNPGPVTGQVGPQDFITIMICDSITLETIEEEVKLERGRNTGRSENLGQGDKPRRNIGCAGDHATAAEVEEIGWAGLMPDSEERVLKNWFSITQSQSQQLPAVTAAAALLHSFDPDLILETADRQVAEIRRFWRTSSQRQCAIQPEAVWFLQPNQHNKQRSRKWSQKCRNCSLKRTCSFENRGYM